jgi:hypothetical protein
MRFSRKATISGKLAKQRRLLIATITLHYGHSKDIILLGPRTSESLEHTFLASFCDSRKLESVVVSL